MVARSPPSLRRSSRRDDLASNTASVRANQLQSPAAISHRAKRNRVSSISDAENLRKRNKIDHPEKSVQYKFPLRSRPNDEPLQSLPLKSGTRVPSSDRRRDIPPTITKQQPADTSAEAQDTDPPKSHPSSEKRTLRSQDGGSRTKSELSLYFTDYEQMLSLEPHKPGLLTSKTQITLIDDLIHPSHSDSASDCLHPKSHAHDLDPFGGRKPLHNAARIDLSLVSAGHTPRRLVDDPLPEDIFHKAHGKAERHEKQLRNIEKERAQHEKVQLERLLGELKGPDWLRVIGVSGITESEKKLYEPKKVFFIREVAALIEKFRHWKEEEKRRKIEREQALLTEDEDGEDDEEAEEDDDDDNDDEEEEDDEADGDSDGEGDDDDDDGKELEGNGQGEDGEAEKVEATALDPSGYADGGSKRLYPTSPLNPSSRPIHRTAAPNSSDVDAAAARQLHQEAISASSPSLTSNASSSSFLLKRRPRPRPDTTITTTAPDRNPTSPSSCTPLLLLHQHSLPQRYKDSGSFFSKPHLREAAIAGHRRGRHKMAFGQPVPDPDPRPFELPAQILTPEMIRKRARERRRVRRGTGSGE